MIRAFIFSALMFATLQTQAAPAVNTLIRVQVKHGMRISDFMVTQAGKEGFIELQSNLESPRRRKLSEKNFEYIKKETAKLATNTYLPADCSRSYVQVHAKGLSKSDINTVSCVGIRTKTTEAYGRYLKILTLAL